MSAPTHCHKSERRSLPYPGAALAKRKGSAICGKRQLHTGILVCGNRLKNQTFIFCYRDSAQFLVQPITSPWATPSKSQIHLRLPSHTLQLARQRHRMIWWKRGKQINHPSSQDHKIRADQRGPDQCGPEVKAWLEEDKTEGEASSCSLQDPSWKINFVTQLRDAAVTQEPFRLGSTCQQASKGLRKGEHSARMCWVSTMFQASPRTAAPEVALQRTEFEPPHYFICMSSYLTKEHIVSQIIKN